jgi:Tfp pilus assembly protein PilF
MGKASRKKKGLAGENRTVARGGLSSSGGARYERFLQKRFVHILLVIVLGFLAYSNTFESPFQWDDIKHIGDNSIIKNLDNFTASTKGYKFNPRRVVGYFTFALNYHFGGTDVTGYHVVNLVIHIVNGILVYFLVMLTFRTPYFTKTGNGQPSTLTSGKWATLHTDGGQVGNRQQHMNHTQEGNREGIARTIDSHSVDYSLFTINSSRSLIALFSALLFVSHPLQTQAVTYIVQRFTSLAALFYLLSLVFYINGRLASRQASKLASFFLSLFFAVCAMKTKENTLTLPLMIVLYEFVFFRTPLKKKLLFILPVLLMLLIIPLSLIRTDTSLGDVLSEMSAKTRIQTQMPRVDYLLTQFRVITTYIRLLLFPVHQNFDYDYPIYHSLFAPQVFLSFIFLTGLFGGAVYLSYRSRAVGAGLVPARLQGRQPQELPLQSPDHLSRLVGFGILWFFLTLSVESSVIPIIDVIFEHRVYLPSVGFFISVTAGLFLAASRFKMEKIAVIALILATLIFTSVSYARNNIWRSNIALWEDVVEKSPNKARGHNNLAIFYSNEGRFDESIKEFKTALRLQPDYADAHNSLGAVYSEQGRIDEAISEFQEALRIKPDFADAHYNLGTAYYSRGLLTEAFREFETAVRIKPNLAKAHNYLGAIHQANGRLDDALKEYRIALRFDPGLASARNNIGNLTDKIRGK